MMYNDKFETKRKNSGKKAVAIALVLVLLLGAVIGTTLAWLIDKTDAVVNTFTIGNINITLEEEGANENKQNFDVVPGQSFDKKATVTVENGSEPCWLFVKIVETGDHTDDWITWNVADDWTSVDGVNNVYYLKVESKVTVADGVSYGVLKDNKVTISGDMTKEWVDELDEMPTLTFQAYAIQSSQLVDSEGNSVGSAATAWTLLKAGLPTSNEG